MINSGEIDDYAAEYVLGTLDGSERAEVSSMRASDFTMEAAIAAWEKRLAPLNERTPTAIPSADVFARIEKRILHLTKATSTRPLLERTIPRRQRFALASAILLVIVVGGSYLQKTYLSAAPQFVAVLAADASTPMFIISLNQKTATIDVHTMAGAAPSDKSYELWVIPAGEKAPRAVGILPNADSKLPVIAGIELAVLAKATLAISVEPLGGSPTGAPTGPVIATGTFKQAKL